MTVVLVVLAWAMGLPGVATAQEESPTDDTIVRAHTVEIAPAESDAAVVLNGRRFGGVVRITGHGTGLAVVETVPLDRYLAGIQEVPFSWEPAALEAQAIAARTYLAWTLARGRTDQGRRYDYDICATDACQVYAGLEPVLAEGGERWQAAVTATGSQILVYEGAPAQTYYSSTSGGRTRTVSDVWPDVDLPYLRAVDSPGEDSPFVDWSWRLPARFMEDVLAAAGLVEGDLVDIRTNTTADGDGPWTITVVSTGGERTMTTWEFRGVLNRWGSEVHAPFLPATRPDGPRYPQTILSPTYVIDRIDLPIAVPGGPGVLGVYQVEGKGWGHLVGMSQYGAQAMAERGHDAAEILAHYYSGLRPQEAPELVPQVIEVALETAAEAVDLEVTGPMTVEVDGRQVAAAELGSWSMASDRGSLVVTTPVGLGLPPVLRPGHIGFERGRLVLRPELSAAAEVEWRLLADGVEVASFGPEPVDAGFLTIPIPIGARSVSLAIQASNAQGGDGIRLEMGDDGQESVDG